MLMVFLLDEGGMPCGFMQKSEFTSMYNNAKNENDDEFIADNVVAFELDLEDDTPDIIDSFYYKCKSVYETWRDNFETIGCDVDLLKKIQISQ